MHTILVSHVNVSLSFLFRFVETRIPGRAFYSLKASYTSSGAVNTPLANIWIHCSKIVLDTFNCNATETIRPEQKTTQPLTRKERETYLIRMQLRNSLHVPHLHLRRIHELVHPNLLLVTRAPPRGSRAVRAGSIPSPRATRAGVHCVFQLHPLAIFHLDCFVRLSQLLHSFE